MTKKFSSLRDRLIEQVGDARVRAAEASARADYEEACMNTSTFHLVIKGNEKEAREECKRRGLVPTNLNELNRSLDEGGERCINTVCDVTGDRSIITTWFSEAPYDDSFPPGTLLFYRETETS